MGVLCLQAQGGDVFPFLASPLSDIALGAWVRMGSRMGWLGAERGRAGSSFYGGKVKRSAEMIEGLQWRRKRPDHLAVVKVAVHILKSRNGEASAPDAGFFPPSPLAGMSYNGVGQKFTLSS